MKDPIHPHCKFKTDLVRERTAALCDTAGEVLNDMADYCLDEGIPFMVTDSVSTAEEDKALNRVSDEHAQGRAFDVRVQGWSEETIEEFIHHFEKKFMCVAAIGKTTGAARLIFRHNVGHGDHLHVQVARLFGLKDPLKQVLA